MERVVPAVAFFGRARSGKTTAARMLAARGWAIVSFAHYMKQMLAQLPGITEEHLHGERKEEVIEPYGKSARQMLQTLGTEWRDTVHRDLWLRLWTLRAGELARDGVPVACDDGRFPHEVEHLRERGVTCIYIHRPEAEGRPVRHVSEALDPSRIPFDAVVQNTRDVDWLGASVRNTLARLGVSS